MQGGGVDWADFDGDGRLDLAIAGDDAGTETTKIYRNENDSTFTALGAGLTGVRDGDLAWGDYNDDGAPDLAVMGVDSDFNETATIYRNEGDGTFTSIGAGLNGVRDGALDWADYNSDGALDLAVAGDNGSAPTAAIYRNDGGGSFTPLNVGLTGVEFADLAWGDFDGNGRPDLLISGLDEEFTVSTTLYQNLGGGSFASISTGTGIERGLIDVERSSVAWGDYDGDGALDVLVSGEFPTENESSETVTLLYESLPNPPPPDFLGTRLREEQRVRVRWDSAAAGDVGRYRIYRETSSITSSPSTVAPFDSTTAPTRSFIDSSTTAGTTYYYRVTAVDTTGSESLVFSSEDTATPKPAAGTLYVDQSATGANDGSSWNDAFVHLQDAADSVNANPYTDYDVRVAEGVYYPDVDKDGDHVADDTTESFRLGVDDVSLLGGYPAGGGGRDPEVYRTVLSGDITQDDSTTSDGVTAASTGIAGNNANTVLRLDGTSSQSDFASELIRSATVVDGLTVTGGQASGEFGADGQGGGVFCDGGNSGNVCSPVVRRVIFRGNRAREGGALSLYAIEGGTSSPSIDATTFRSNEARVGGALYAYGVQGTISPIIEESRFRNNRARQGGAMAVEALQQSTARPALVNVTARGNTAGRFGGALFLFGGDSDVQAKLANVLFYGNASGDEGGAVYTRGSGGGTVDPRFINTTFAGNEADVVGGAVSNDGTNATVTPTFSNSILWGNTAGAGGDEVVNNDATPAFNHSLVEGTGGSANWSGAGTDAGGNLDANPLFVDTSAVDLRPQEDSPVLEAGDNSLLPADTSDLDADGDSTEALPLDRADSTRVVDDNGSGTATVNMGAYEVVGPDRTPLTAPDTLAITAFTDSLRVGWSAIAGGDLAKYRIYRDTASIDSVAGPSSVTPLDSVGAGTTVYTDTTVSPDTTYHYRITAVDDAGNESSFSPEVRDSAAAALTVWPGDTDNDGAVNQDDVLPLGFQWGQTGPARDSTGCAFKGRAAAAWPTKDATYADANGDGLVDQDDVLCIGLNWGDSTATAKARPLYAASSSDEKLTQRGGPSPTRPARPEEDAETSDVRAPTSQTGAAEPAGPTSKQDASPGRGKIVLDAPTEPDSVLWVKVRAKNVRTIGGAAFEVSYPASKATVETVETRDWFGENALAQSHVDDAAGIVGVGMANADTVRSGSGVLARLQVRLDEKVTEPVTLQLRKARVGLTARRITDVKTGGEVSVRRVPEKFKLYGNYPNPIQQSTTIRYDLPSERRVELRVYDVLGRRVATLVNETQEPGRKRVTWEAGRVASGVYVYRLTAGDQSETGKMTVVQ